VLVHPELLDAHIDAHQVMDLDSSEEIDNKPVGDALDPANP
jgi:hypothetical protein